MWEPCSIPQIIALISPADVVGYGGAAGGGKTDLELGCAITQHTRSLICRREAVQLEGLTDRAKEIVGTARNFNGTEKRLQLGRGRFIKFGSMKGPDDWRKYQGRAYDLMAFDETAHFLEHQVRTLMGWNRTADPGQRCRVLMGFNPPTNAEGAWLIGFFAPWLDDTHSNPARPGELRWFVTDENGKDLEVTGPDPVDIEGRKRNPKSRTFVPARIEDNPHLMGTGYVDTLDALPEPLRSMMRDGNFSAGQDDDEWQVIPTAWIKAAQDRWTADGGRGVDMDSLGLDPSRGGRDETVIAARNGHWFAPLKTYPGSAVPDGPTAAGLAMAMVRDGAPIHVDVIGIGASVYDHLSGAGVLALPVNCSAASGARDKTGVFGFRNVRAELWWRMREALDPSGNCLMALPPDRGLLADLAAPRWKYLAGGKVQIEAKDDIKKRLGRSPDRGDAVVNALIETPKEGTNLKGPTGGGEF